MNTVIFGGAGFVGRDLTKALLDRGDQVVVVDNLLIEPEGLLDERAQYKHIDATDPMAVRTVLHWLADLWKGYQVVHLQARQGYDLDYRAYADVNVGSAYALMEAVSNVGGHFRGLQEYGVQGVLVASSQAIYEPRENVVESGCQFSPSLYGITKRQQEEALHWFCERSGVPLMAMRYSIILGWGQALQSSESGIMRNWLKCHNKGEPFQVYGTGHQVRDFVHIEDVTRANVEALDYNQTGAFNVYGFAKKIRAMAEIFKAQTGTDYVITGTELRPGGEYTLTSISERIEGLLDWRPELAPEDQIRSFLDFAAAQAETGEAIPG